MLTFVRLTSYKSNSGDVINAPDIVDGSLTTSRIKVVLYVKVDLPRTTLIRAESQVLNFFIDVDLIDFSKLDLVIKIYNY